MIRSLDQLYSNILKYIRLEREGYKAPEIVALQDSPAQESPVLQTLTLQELAEKTNMDDLKVFLSSDPIIKNHIFYI